MSTLCDSVMLDEKIFLMGINIGPMYAAQEKSWGGTMAYAVQAAVEFADNMVRKLVRYNGCHPVSMDVLLEDMAAVFSSKFDTNRVIDWTKPDEFWEKGLVLQLLNEAFNEVMGKASIATEDKRLAFLAHWASIIK